MSVFNRANLLWLLTNTAKKLSIWGLIGLFLLLASVIVYCLKAPHISQQIRAIKAEQTALIEHQSQVAKRGQKPLVENTEQEVTKFYARFPSAKALPTVLATLNNMAKQQNIELIVGDYKFSEVKTKQREHVKVLTQYQIVFPVQGSYSSIRQFVAQSLKALPEIALIDLQIVRETSTSAMVDARLEFVAYVKGEAWQQ